MLFYKVILLVLMSVSLSFASDPLNDDEFLRSNRSISASGTGKDPYGLGAVFASEIQARNRNIVRSVKREFCVEGNPTILPLTASSTNQVDNITPIGGISPPDNTSFEIPQDVPGMGTWTIKKDSIIITPDEPSVLTWGEVKRVIKGCHAINGLTQEYHHFLPEDIKGKWRIISIEKDFSGKYPKCPVIDYLPLHDQLIRALIGMPFPPQEVLRSWYRKFSIPLSLCDENCNLDFLPETSDMPRLVSIIRSI